MADKARDFKVSVLTDADRFNLARPAAEIEDLGKKAGNAAPRLDDLERSAGTTAGELNALARNDAARGLDDVERGAGDAERALDDLGRSSSSSLDDVETASRSAGDKVDTMAGDVDAAAGKVDSAFDKIAAASKRGAQDVDQATGKGKESLRDMGEEGQGTAREMAASFDGTADGIRDAMQEAATNVLATLGPLGAAVGVAGGVAIGWFRGEAERAKEAISDLVGTIIDAGGRLDRQGVLEQLRKFAEDGTISDLAAEARAGKVDVGDYLRAMSGDADALARTRTALDDSRTALERKTDAMREAGTITEESAQANQDQIIALVNMSTNLDKTADKYALANEAAAIYNQTAGETEAAIEDVAGALESFVDPAGAYEEALGTLEEAERNRAQVVADKTKDASDSWEDHVQDVEVSTQDYLDTLDEQVSAMEGWAGNLQTLAARGVDEGVIAELAAMGPKAAPLVAKFATASDAELARLQTLYARRGAASGTDYAAGLLGQRPQVAGAASGIWEVARDRLSPEVRVPVGVQRPSQATLSGVNSGIRSGIGTVTVPLMLQRVPQSIWSTQRSVP